MQKRKHHSQATKRSDYDLTHPLKKSRRENLHELTEEKDVFYTDISKCIKFWFNGL